MIMNNKYTNQSQPQGHEDLQTETDNIASLESTSARKSVSVVPVTVEQNKNENKFDLIDRFSQIFKKKVTAVEDE